jgi:hypothetical protein
MPLWHIFIGNSRGNIEHDDGAIAANANINSLLITFTKPSQLLLTCCVPDIEFYWAMVRVKGNRVDLNSLGGDVFLFELSS